MGTGVRGPALRHIWPAAIGAANRSYGAAQSRGKALLAGRGGSRAALVGEHRGALSDALHRIRGIDARNGAAGAPGLGGYPDSGGAVLATGCRSLATAPPVPIARLSLGGGAAPRIRRTILRTRIRGVPRGQDDRVLSP